MVESTKKDLQEIIGNTKLRIALIGATGAIGPVVVPGTNGLKGKLHEACI